MSDRLNEIDDEITELKCQFENIEGTKTEVYSRIVGYYRAVKNWNRGKSDEYKQRVMFKPGELPDITGGPVDKRKEVQDNCTTERKQPFGIVFNEELTATRIA